MMTATGIGLLIGRLLFSYLLVLFVALCFSKFQLKSALGKLHSWKGGLAVAALFLLPMLAQMGASA